MYRRVTLHCPVDLDELDGLEPVTRRALLRFLTFAGIEKVSVVARGGDRRPLAPDDGEAFFVEPADKPYPQPAEERFGRGIKVDLHAIY